jgi:hypothetical protein
MPILQEQSPDPAAPSQIVTGSLNSPQDLEYPHAPIPVNQRNSAMRFIPWTIGLLVGILIFLTHLPLDPPRMDQLTLYTCDPLPMLPSLGSRQSYPLNLRCRAGDQVIYQRTNTIPYPYQATTISCVKQTGPARIWRMAPPSPYGSYLFQVACDGHIVSDYQSRATGYKATQLFVATLASLLCLAGALGLIISLFEFRQRGRVSNS